MTRNVIIDTGPLVAFVDRKDSYHAWALATWDGIEPPLLTCEPVLSEACFLLQNLSDGPATVMELVERGVIAVKFDVESEAARIRRLLTRYANVPMSLADACLVRMTELWSRGSLLTLDADFRIYRKEGRQVIPLLMSDNLE